MAEFLHWPTTAVGCQLHLGHQAQMGQAKSSVATESIACAAMATGPQHNVPWPCNWCTQSARAPQQATLWQHTAASQGGQAPLGGGVQHFQVMCGKKLIHNLVNENIGVPRKGEPLINLALFWGGLFLYCGCNVWQRTSCYS